MRMKKLVQQRETKDTSLMQKTKLFPTRMIVEVIAVRMEEKVRDNIPPEPGTFASLNFAGR